MHSKLVRTPGIYVIGYMGAGKTTIGQLLADELGWYFADLDQDIEADHTMSISQIFEQRGEAEFRGLEHEALRKRVRNIQCGKPTVVAMGGGAYAQSNNYELAEENGVTIWLDCSLERIRQRIAGQTHRPLAADPNRFEELYHARQPAYAKAEYRVEITSDDPGEIVKMILSFPIF